MKKTSDAFIHGENLGKKAYHAGKVCTPCLDSEVMDFMAKNDHLSSLEILRGWSVGWTKANLAD